MQNLLQQLAANRQGENKGIFSVCSAHPWVIEAALNHAKTHQLDVLIEATANQVNQFGGYTAMQPADFIQFVKSMAKNLDCDEALIHFGGDHLGPVCWQHKPAEEAMMLADSLIADYVRAGFKKIHLDTSMACADDSLPLCENEIAARAARLCAIAEQTARTEFGKSDIYYVIGTEVPPPGGADEVIDSLTVTAVSDVERTLQLHQKAFFAAGLAEAWQRVIGVVVQPGVEFDNWQVVQFDASKAAALKTLVSPTHTWVYEAHSTDYQHTQQLAQLVENHFAILKVGPELTFALREALFGLSHIEELLVAPLQQSHLRQVVANDMATEPASWQRFYHGTSTAQAMQCYFSLSDRIRYFWTKPHVQAAVSKLIANINTLHIPKPLLRQYLPYAAELDIAKNNEGQGKRFATHYVERVIARYASACGQL
ncbi:D-tagatose-bisphosphate aldolase, class II, non-catalytic subunit [Pseudoalteromonas fenneropenaei]|uniref:D-tagatose-bisphosphate aldolase, class II, non-catalytic subunit n=1 Tax=Pseudoalteromonas fenneropenaei TaxID=1737459 RepID=A0ABV7CPK5_9GAMM